MKSVKIGTIEFAAGAALAPMAGVTDTTMRRLCASYGAVCTVSEMVSAKALAMGDKKSPRLMAGGGGSAPYGIQLFGADVQSVFDIAWYTFSRIVADVAPPVDEDLDYFESQGSILSCLACGKYFVR